MDGMEGWMGGRTFSERISSEARGLMIALVGVLSVACVDILDAMLQFAALVSPGPSSLSLL